MKSLQTTIRILMLDAQSKSLMFLYKLSGNEELKERQVKTNVTMLIMRDRLSNNVLFPNF